MTENIIFPQLHWQVVKSNLLNTIRRGIHLEEMKPLNILTDKAPCPMLDVRRGPSTVRSNASCLKVTWVHL